jgi:hypothetical protein
MMLELEISMVTPAVRMAGCAKQEPCAWSGEFASKVFKGLEIGVRTRAARTAELAVQFLPP